MTHAIQTGFRGALPVHPTPIPSGHPAPTTLPAPGLPSPAQPSPALPAPGGLAGGSPAPSALWHWQEAAGGLSPGAESH